MTVNKKKYSVRRFSSFKEAEEYELEEMRKLSYEERLSILLSIVKNRHPEIKETSKEDRKYLKLRKRKLK
jgi:hypothetical protein